MVGSASGFWPLDLIFLLCRMEVVFEYAARLCPRLMIEQLPTKMCRNKNILITILNVGKEEDTESPVPPGIGLLWSQLLKLEFATVLS